MPMPDTPCSKQPDNMPESPCLPHCPPPPHWQESSSLEEEDLSNGNQQSRVHTLTNLLYWALGLRSLYNCPNHDPMPGAGQLRTSPMPQSLLKLFTLANPKLLIPNHSFLRRETTIKALRTVPPSPLPPDQPGASPCGPPMLWHASFFLETVSSKLSFQWQLSPDLLAFLYLTFFINPPYLFMYWPCPKIVGSVSQPGVEHRSQQWMHWILTTRSLGNLQYTIF